MAAHQLPAALWFVKAPACESSPTHAGRVASQKKPFARITPRWVSSGTSCSFFGANGGRARKTKLWMPYSSVSGL